MEVGRFSRFETLEHSDCSLTMPRWRDELVEVEAPCGRLIGARDSKSGIISFLGVPYAEAPVGSGRFGRCEPKARFSQPRLAVDYGPASAQVFDPRETDLSEFDKAARGEPAYVGTEDSLSLNLWTPACDRKRRPTLIFIHGGANWLESSRLSTYQGAFLAGRGEIVVVTLNYRLGVLGALDLTVLGGEAPAGAHANCIRDQLCAVDWVRRNVEAMGGDPGNITLAGESAGSMDISWMIAADELKGRVRRVVMMSGVGSVVGFGHDHIRSVHQLHEGRRRARDFLRTLHVHSFHDLNTLQTSDLLRRCAEAARNHNILFDMDTLFYPRVDESFARCDPFTAADRGAAKELDVLIGFTGYELGLWLNWDEQLDKRSARWASQVCPFLPDHLRSQLAVLYEREFCREPEGVQGMHLLSDAMFGIPSLIFAERATRSNANCWMYRFDYPSADPRRGALHAADMCFFLGTWNTKGGVGLLGSSGSNQIENERRRLSSIMQDSLISFVRCGDPNTPQLPQWPRFTAGAQHFLRLHRNIEIKSGPLAERGKFWLEKIAAPILGS